MNSRRALRVLALCLSSFVLLAGCGKDGGGGGDERTSAGDSTSTTAAVGGELDPTGSPVAGAEGGSGSGSKAGTDAKGTATTAKGGSSNASGSGGQSTTRTTLESDLGEPQDPGRWVNPKEGTYTYATTRGTSTSNMKPMKDPYKVQITNTGASKGPFRYTYHETSDTGGVADHSYIFKADGVEWDRKTQKGITCDWTPENEHLALPFANGQQWSSTSTCTEQAGPVTVTRKLTDNGKTVRWGRVKVGGNVVDCYVVERSSTLENNYLANGQTKKSSSVITETEWWAAKNGILAREVVTTKFTDDEGDTETFAFERILQNLSPS